MSEYFIVNSPTSLLAASRWLKDLYEKHKYVTLSPRIGPDRSLNQNSLFHVWCTEYAAHLLGKDKKQVTKGELAGMKRQAKRMYYAETGSPWMVHEVVNPKNQSERKKDFTSSADWKQGEMFLVLTWLQVKGAEDGIVLESMGEYQKLQREAA